MYEGIIWLFWDIIFFVIAHLLLLLKVSIISVYDDILLQFRCDYFFFGNALEFKLWFRYYY